MNTLADSLHDMEGELEQIKRIKSLNGNDFLVIALRLKQIYKQIKLVRDAIEKITSLRKALKKSNKKGSTKKPKQKPIKLDSLIPHEATANDSWAKMVCHFAEGIGRQYNKELRVNLERFNEKAMSSSELTCIREVIIQLVRNAAVHGIEQVDDRIIKGKKPQGQIKIYSERLNNQEMIHIRDDGRGIVLEEIREKLRADKNLCAEDVQNMTQSKLIKMLFKPGFSTAKEVDINAGRGVGLDLVRSSIESTGAKLSLKFKEGVYTQFTIILPPSLEQINAL